jgi:hypothetical protein
MGHVTGYFKVLYKMVKPFLYINGGNIIMVQIENEYGYTSCDKAYLQSLVDLAHKYLSPDVFLFTTDGSSEGALKCGSLKSAGVYPTIDFGVEDPTDHFKLQRKFNDGHGPYVCSEFWVGWYDKWGDGHSTRSADSVADVLDKILALDANVNMYMYFGGTNFGYMNGGNGDWHSYGGITTSYDYDAPLSEHADMTWKWTRVRDTIAKYVPNLPKYEVSNYTKKAFGNVTFQSAVTIWDAVDLIKTNVTKTEKPVKMEELGVGYGFALYRAKSGGGALTIPYLRDRASVYVDQKLQGIMEGHGKDGTIQVAAGNLDILLENEGRIGFGLGGDIPQHGFIDGVLIDGKVVTDWENVGLDLKKIPKGFPEKAWHSIPELPSGCACAYRGFFHVDHPADTFLNPTGFVKGIAFVNGFNLGRYWATQKPQLTLYVPATFLVSGENELIIFELENKGPVGTMSFDDHQQFNW